MRIRSVSNHHSRYLDRSDAADLMSLERHDLGLSGKKTRFPLKETVTETHSLSINSAASIDHVLSNHYPQFIEWEKELRKLFARIYRGQAKAKRSRL